MKKIKNFINKIKEVYKDIEFCFEEKENQIIYIYFDNEEYDLNDEFDAEVIKLTDECFGEERVNFFLTYKENFNELKERIEKHNNNIIRVDYIQSTVLKDIYYDILTSKINDNYVESTLEIKGKKYDSKHELLSTNKNEMLIESVIYS
ncbi:MAG: hypothetical protein JW924_12310 [Fusobacteriaceae bacterium]|nr:hypothetical protein [Fusobacteriaceae bacterium]